MSEYALTIAEKVMRFFVKVAGINPENVLTIIALILRRFGRR